MLLPGLLSFDRVRPQRWFEEEFPQGFPDEGKDAIIVRSGIGAEENRELIAGASSFRMETGRALVNR